MSDASPVQCLCGQILHVFENANATSAPMLRKAVAEGSINAAIELNCVAGIPKTPFVDGIPPTIWLHITHLEMLWAFTYGMFVSYEHEMRETMVRMDILPTVPAYSETIRRRAANLLLWSKGLRQAYTEWPSDAPSPKSYLPEEKTLAGKVNTIFLAAVALMLHHEFCHAVQRHMAPDRAPEEILEQEKEADDFAHHQFIDGSSAEHDKRIQAWSVLVPSLSCFYLAKKPASFFQERHPHVHHRVAHALSRLDFLDQENQDYFNGLCVIALTSYMAEHNLLDADFQNDPNYYQGFDRASDAFDYFLGQMDLLDELPS